MMSPSNLSGATTGNTSGTSKRSNASASNSSTQSFLSPESQYSSSSFHSKNRSASEVSDFDLAASGSSQDLVTVSRSDSITSRMSSYHLTNENLVSFSQLTNFHEETDQPLGHGSFGTVFKAVYKESAVAVKIYNQIDPTNQIQVHEFLSEAYQTMQLASPYTVKFLGICAQPPEPCCLILELMDCSLYDYLKSTQAITFKQQLLIALDIMNGLIDLFKKNVIQRDLKTSNILLSKEDKDGIRHAKLCDFDLVLTKLPEARFASTKALFGTIPWLPPEILELEFMRKESNDDEDDETAAKKDQETVTNKAGFIYDPKTSVYTFGWILWSLLTGKTPFEYNENCEKLKGVDRLNLMHAVIKQIIQGQRADIPVQAPPEYSALIMATWDPEPGLRPSFKEVKSTLNQIHAKYCA